MKDSECDEHICYHESKEERPVKVSLDVSPAN